MRSSKSNQRYHSLVPNCHLKLPVMKAPGFKQVDGGSVWILACSLGWLLVEDGVLCAGVRSWILDLVVMSELAGPCLRSSHWERAPGFCSHALLGLTLNSWLQIQEMLCVTSSDQQTASFPLAWWKAGNPASSIKQLGRAA